MMASGQPLIVEGRAVKLDWKTANEENLVVQGVPVERAEKKLAALKTGGDKAETNPLFPNNRACQDALWIVLFVVFGLGVVAYGASCASKALENVKDDTNTSSKKPDDLDIELPSLSQFGSMVLACLATAVATSYGFIAFARRHPTCLVWTSLIAGPVFGVAAGFAMVVAGANSGNVYLLAIGGIFVFLNVCLGTCVLFCYRSLIPFMAKLTEVVADVIEEHPCCIGVGLMGSFLAVVWTVVMGFSFASVLIANPEITKDENNKVARYGFFFLFALALTWGGLVANNICHVTYCGVFGRWYFGGQDDSSASDVEATVPSLGKGTPNTLAPSLCVALTTSLGSICAGSFLVAFVRALEYTVRQCQRDAAKDGNYVLCIILCVVECFISCIGDILEYFSEWAYVQCAIRGVSFFDAASITFTLFTCCKIDIIIADLLLNSLVSCGAMMTAAMCAIVTGGLGFSLGGATTAAYGAGIGLFIGLIAGSAALGVINSGIKTILACWSEDSRPLMHTHKEVHDEFASRILYAVNGGN